MSQNLAGLGIWDNSKFNMKTPKPITYNTGDAPPGYKLIDKFFESIIKKDIKLPLNHPHIEKKIKDMYKCRYGEKLESGAYTDEHIHLLLYKEKVIATVIETRTIGNYVHFDFFQNLENIIENP